MGTITVRARLEKTHLNDSFRRCGAIVEKSWNTYDLDDVAYKAFMADPAIQVEIVTDFAQEEDAPATAALDEGDSGDTGDGVDEGGDEEDAPAPSTVNELKAALKERGMKIPKGANKAALIELYESQPE